MNYREVNPAIGSMKDLAELTEKLHDNEITLTIDLVLNHVAREHEWAVRAENGANAPVKYANLFNAASAILSASASLLFSSFCAAAENLEATFKASSRTSIATSFGRFCRVYNG